MFFVSPYQKKEEEDVFCFISMRQWQIMLLGVYLLGVGNFLSCKHQKLIRGSETFFHLAESGWGRVVKFIDCYTLYLKFLSPWCFTWIMWIVQLIPFKLHALLLLMDLSLLRSISFNTLLNYNNLGIYWTSYDCGLW